MLLVSHPRDLVNRLVAYENTNGWTVIWYDANGVEKGRAGYADAVSREDAVGRFEADHSDKDLTGMKCVWYGPMDQLPPPGTKYTRT
jgi:hypothetical protein